MIFQWSDRWHLQHMSFIAIMFYNYPSKVAKIWLNLCPFFFQKLEYWFSLYFYWYLRLQTLTLISTVMFHKITNPIINFAPFLNNQLEFLLWCFSKWLELLLSLFSQKVTLMFLQISSQWCKIFFSLWIYHKFKLKLCFLLKVNFLSDVFKLSKMIWFLTKALKFSSLILSSL